MNNTQQKKTRRLGYLGLMLLCGVTQGWASTRTHQGEVNYWLERFKPTTIEVVNETDQPVTLEWVCKNRPVRVWESHHILLQAPTNYQFIASNDDDQHGFPIIDAISNQFETDYVDGPQPIHVTALSNKIIDPIGSQSIKAPESYHFSGFRNLSNLSDIFLNIKLIEDKISFSISPQSHAPEGLSEMKAIQQRIFYDFPDDSQLFCDTTHNYSDYKIFLEGLKKHILGTTEEETREKRKIQLRINHCMMKDPFHVLATCSSSEWCNLSVGAFSQLI